MAEARDTETYRGYTFAIGNDDVQVWYGSDLVDPVRFVESARQLVDGWQDAR